MKLLLKRIAKRSTYTIGHLYIDGEYFCDTCEDTDRGLSSDMPIRDIRRIKQPAITAIPTGTYDITLKVVSPKFSKKDFYLRNANGGRLPRLINVPGWEGVLIHTGNTADHSEGCILVGKNKQVGKVLYSMDTFIALYKILYEADQKGEKITIQVM